MIWGCFSRKGVQEVQVGPLFWIKGNMDHFAYQKILDKPMLPYIKRNMSQDWIFQDNDPKHSFQYVKEYINKQKIKVLEWSSQSPDLNPIEHM